VLNTTTFNPYFYRDFPGYESLWFWPSIAPHHRDWLKVEDYNALTKEIYRDVPLDCQVAFTEQQSESFYEWQIFQERLVPTRNQSWHDFFNNLTWLTWPRLKSALIKRLCEDSLSTGNPSRARSPLQNCLTQLDEFGAVICCDDEELISHIKNFQWQTLFLTPDLLEHCQCTLIGHGLFEKLLNPFIGLTAKAIILQVKSDYFRLPYPEQLSFVDKALAQYLLSETFPKASKALQPFPILGWPTWHANQDEAFYANKRYFREKGERNEQEVAHYSDSSS
jgi:hypothetical protein